MWGSGARRLPSHAPPRESIVRVRRIEVARGQVHVQLEIPVRVEGDQTVIGIEERRGDGERRRQVDGNEGAVGVIPRAAIARKPELDPPLGAGEPGPITRRLLAAWSELVGVDVVGQAERQAARAMVRT